jgi:hypothetical protein
VCTERKKPTVCIHTCVFVVCILGHVECVMTCMYMFILSIYLLKFCVYRAGLLEMSHDVYVYVLYVHVYTIHSLTRVLCVQSGPAWKQREEEERKQKEVCACMYM